MMCAMMTVCDPGDKVVVFSPFYENYGADAILSDAKPIYVPLHPPLFNFDKKELEDAFKQHPKALILCNPSNPCGKVFTREELEYIASHMSLRMKSMNILSMHQINMCILPLFQVCLKEQSHAVH